MSAYTELDYAAAAIFGALFLAYVATVIGMHIHRMQRQEHAPLVAALVAFWAATRTQDATLAGSHDSRRQVVKS